MTYTSTSIGTIGVPDVNYINEFGLPEFHYTWFHSMDDALDYAYQLQDTPLECTPESDWDALNDIITYDG